MVKATISGEVHRLPAAIGVHIERQWQPRWPILITREEMLASVQRAVDALGGADQVTRLRTSLEEEEEASMVLLEN